MSPSNSLTPTPRRDLAPAPEVLALVEDWHKSLDLTVAAGDLSDETAYVYKTGLRKLMEWIEARGYVTEDLIREWIADLRTAYATAAISTWFAGVRSFFKWAKGRGLIAFDPTEGIKRGKRKKASLKHKREQLTDSEILRVLSLPDDSPSGKRARAILYLMAYTAARTIEIHRADLEDLKTKDNRLVLYVQGKGHTDKDEVLVIANPLAEAALQDWLTERGDKPGPLFTSFSRRSLGQRLSRSFIREMVKGYYKAAGVRGEMKTTHSLRHTAITSAIRHGAPVQKVQGMARHTNISTTMIYFHEVDRVENPAEKFIEYGE